MRRKQWIWMACAVCVPMGVISVETDTYIESHRLSRGRRRRKKKKNDNLFVYAIPTYRNSPQAQPQKVFVWRRLDENVSRNQPLYMGLDDGIGVDNDKADPSTVSRHRKLYFSPTYRLVNWLRIILFCLLVFFPLARALSLWYRAGGRLRFERRPLRRRRGHDNDNQMPHDEGRWRWRLVYTAPNPLWVAQFMRPELMVVVGPNANGHSLPTLSNQLLTKEQVLALPEVSYPMHPNPTYDQRDGNDDNDGHNSLIEYEEGRGNSFLSMTNNTDITATTANMSVLSSPLASLQEEVEPSSLLTNTTIIPPTTDTDIYIDAPKATIADRGMDMGTTNTLKEPPSLTSTFVCGSVTCSICLDDFEDGEMVRQLPCCHLFHTECIMPWLTERRGCCPLCKVPVVSSSSSSSPMTTTTTTTEEP